MRYGRGLNCKFTLILCKHLLSSRFCSGKFLSISLPINVDRTIVSSSSIRGSKCEQWCHISSERYEYYCWYSVSASSSWFELLLAVLLRVKSVYSLTDCKLTRNINWCWVYTQAVGGSSPSPPTLNPFDKWGDFCF